MAHMTRPVCWAATVGWDGERVRERADGGAGAVNGQGLTVGEVAALLRQGKAVRVLSHPRYIGEVMAEMERQGHATG